MQIRYELIGRIQGIGFRPIVFRLARNLGLGGFVCNEKSHVILVLKGENNCFSDLEKEFWSQLNHALPQGALILSKKIVEDETIAPGSDDSRMHSRDFFIKNRDDTANEACSSESNIEAPIIPPDFRICSDCLADLHDQENLRHQYAFVTCTQCGPRYSLVHEMPFDRSRTAMVDFATCPLCSSEYGDVDNRRFHAQTISCPNCGPKLRFVGQDGRSVSGLEGLVAATQALLRGQILAMKGVGGYQLVVDAHNEEGVARLRRLKHRARKPFAVMMHNLQMVEKFCYLSEQERASLQSPEGPIVILDCKDESFPGARGLASTLGVMLPTSGLHELLFTIQSGAAEKTANEHLQVLVVTSGNIEGEPICSTADEATEFLSGIAECFLHHNRQIVNRLDDSLLRKNGEEMQVWRRARGYCPNPLFFLNRAKGGTPGPCVLALGVDLKNAFALADDRAVYLAPHVGDLRNIAAKDYYELAITRFINLLSLTPEVVVVDMHPDFFASRFGMAYAARHSLELKKVQHHHAHALSVMAEHGLAEAHCLVFDGLGLGLDGTIWGAELLRCQGASAERVASFLPSRLLGGDKAVFEPRRQLFTRLVEAGLAENARLFGSQEEIKLWTVQLERGLNSPLSHAAGRLFDAVSVLLGAVDGQQVCDDAEAAVRLEQLAAGFPEAVSLAGFSSSPTQERAEEIKEIVTERSFKFSEIERDGVLLIDWSPVIAEMASLLARKGNAELSLLAWRFHCTVARAAERMVEYSFTRSAFHGFCDKPQRTSLNITLSGGVFMNRILTSLCRNIFIARGFLVFTNRLVPPNDGGVAVGQACFVKR